MDMNLSKLRKTVEADVLQSMGSQRVGHDLATGQQPQHTHTLFTLGMYLTHLV